MVSNEVRLLLDVGNSRIKWCLHVRDRCTPMQLLPADADYDDWLQLIDPAPTVAWLSCVAARRSQALREHLQRRGLKTASAVSSAALAGLRNGYRDPAQLGVDRFCALLGALQLHPGRDCLIIDAGTALTIDLLRADGRHLGGCILPGLSLMRSALGAGTDQLGKSIAADALPAELDTTAVADHTALAIELGIRHAAIGAIERLRRGRPDWPLLLTGGDAPLLSLALAKPWELRDSLVLDGLARYAAAVQTG